METLEVSIDEFCDMIFLSDLEKRDGLCHVATYVRNHFGIISGEYAVKVSREKWKPAFPRLVQKTGGQND